MLVLRSFILFFLFAAELWVAQPKENIAYEHIRDQYRTLKEGDAAALPYIDLLISLAQRENNYAALTSAYLDAVYYEPTACEKLKYADSAIAEAPYSCRNSLIAAAYMEKGKVYYHYFKDYLSAQDNFLKAVPFVLYSDDVYRQKQLLHQFGLIKIYMTNFTGAIADFTECVNFFSSELRNGVSDATRRTARKDYLESLHQLANCYQQMGDDQTADRLIAMGESELRESPGCSTLSAYFSKSRAISDYRKGNFDASKASLNRALPGLIRAKDFAWISVVYFYLGKNAVAQRERSRAHSYFKKVDSVYQQHRFIFPELQDNYRILIGDARKKTMTEQAIRYACRLRDSEIVNDENWHHLYARFEEARVKDEQKSADQRHLSIITGVVALSCGLLAYTAGNRLERKAETEGDREQADERGATEKTETKDAGKPDRSMLSPETRMMIRKNLEKFEAEKGFLTPHLRRKNLAKIAGTNANYLSRYLNDEKRMSVPGYLAVLRVAYLAGRLAEDPLMAAQSADFLAAHCGIASASNLGTLFLEHYGMPLWKYQKECRMKFTSENGGNSNPERGSTQNRG